MIIDHSKLSPMMKRFFEIKDNYPDSILFFRLGDFYEMFFDDAITASKALDITLTGRDCGQSERAPMCGIPHHAADSYIRRLIEQGFRVAICEQLSDPATSKGMVERDVVRVVTSGTLMEEDILDEKSANYLASVYTKNDGFGISWVDISTGEFNLFELASENNLERLSDILSTISPTEIICCPDFLTKYKNLTYFINQNVKPKSYYEYSYNFQTATKKLAKAFSVNSLDVFECSDKIFAVTSAGGLYEYLLQTQKRALSQFNSLNFVQDKSFMLLDGATRKNLELVSRQKDGKNVNTLLSVLDKTSSAMGARTLRKYIEQPLLDSVLINDRLDAVECLVSSKPLRERLSDAFSNIRDLERLAGRLAYGSATPKDLLSILDTLAVIPTIKNLISSQKNKMISSLNNTIDDLPNVYLLLESSLDRESCINYKNGGYIKSGFDETLDELRDIKSTATQWLSNLEDTERKESGIKTLKIGFNRVFGYYIEISNSFKDKVPYRYQRKQTLVNAERYITEELKQIEERILSADANAVCLEEKIFSELKLVLYKNLTTLQNTASALATLDTLLSFAIVAQQNGYTKPNISNKIEKINIVDGKHPIVENIIGKNSYVTNNTSLDCADNRTMVITGPNMAGKSTYMRQVALIVLMAHIGSFVPAKLAEISLTDRIFTRIGASDDLSSGRSTFMVEMVEVATILNNATSKSLLVLDEIGRGTSTFDGLSIAWAVLEYITQIIKCKTLFATHYHELTELEDLQGVNNYRVLVSEQKENILFLYKIVKGGASRSFGIEVASLAGVIKPVVNKAKEIMKSLEQNSKTNDTNELLLKSSAKNNTQQVCLFDSGSSSKIEQQIMDIDVDNLTPMQSFSILCDLKKQIENN